jgi:aerobic-type carbon monoxide dehydrogenase small subunit (CoxS/CutS family)
MEPVSIQFNVNGREVSRDVDPGLSLLEFLRREMGLMGTREGCGHGDCGSCTVLVDGRPMLSCIMYAFQAHGRSVTTIEALSADELDSVQKSFVEKGAIQCGFCSPAMILVGKALLAEKPHPSRDEIREAISGVLCRCTGYRKIVDAIEEAGGH